VAADPTERCCRDDRNLAPYCADVDLPVFWGQCPPRLTKNCPFSSAGPSVWGMLQSHPGPPEWMPYGVMAGLGAALMIAALASLILTPSPDTGGRGSCRAGIALAGTIEHAVHRGVLCRHRVVLRRQHNCRRGAGRSIRFVDIPRRHQPLAALFPRLFIFGWAARSAVALLLFWVIEPAAK
jgi:hypothetical protein